MADLAEQLQDAAADGDAAAVQAALAAGADPNAAGSDSWTALHFACSREDECSACVQALLAAGADPNAADHQGWRALHLAAMHGHAQSVHALLAAGADATATAADGCSALHTAAESDSMETGLALLEAAPHVALLRDGSGFRPFDLAMMHGCYESARCLLEHGPLPLAGELLGRMESRATQWWQEEPPVPASLFAPLVARQPLAPAEWQRVPTPCPGLGAALPAVLARSEAEAALLVEHLPAADLERLRTAALCLRRAERVSGLELPAELLRPLLLAAVA